jgi:hypothetical protein
MKSKQTQADIFFQHKNPSTMLLPPPLQTAALQMTELEVLLAEKNGSLLKDKLLDNLVKIEERLRQKIAGSLTRGDYIDYLAVADATHASIEVLRSWPVQPLIKSSLISV